LAGYDFPEEVLRSALGGAKSAILETGDETVRGLALASIVETIQELWILVIVAGAVSLVSGVFMKREKLNLEVAAVG
jgi:hypothetical protein